MSILGTPEQLRSVWQRRAVKSLAVILDAADRRELPALHWTLSTRGALKGSCLDSDMEKRRAAFIAWVEWLGIEDWRAWDSNGVTYMSGTAGDAYHGDSGMVRLPVIVTAAIDSPTEVPAGV